MNATELLTIAEAARMLRLSKPEVEYLCRTGALSYLRMPGTSEPRFQPSDIQRFVDNHRIAGLPSVQSGILPELCTRGPI